MAGQGKKVLIHAASGGVGHMAIQIAKSFGAQVTGTSSVANRDFVLSPGADSHIDYRNQPLNAWPTDFDFILDTVGRETTVGSLSFLKKGGTLVSILPPTRGLPEKTAQENINFHFVLMESCAADITAIAGLLESGVISARIAQQFSLENLGEAHKRLETGHIAGKIVIVP